MALAPRVDGEIVSADSRHVYRRMDIGTNKPTPQERSAVPHHLLDLREPWESFSLAEYVALARAALDVDGDAGAHQLAHAVGGEGDAALEHLGLPRHAERADRGSAHVPAH